ncbi:MAG: translesion DNA synthesis-associated protein ImuA [Burkholderiales bacterium]|nr:translesion DNA synthesis-associated protein ImuA [Burkholderiales bacterium]
MAAPGANPRPAPEDLHPALWRAHQLGRQREAGWASGFAELDAVLPGAGWPARALTELLLAHPGIGEMRLLCPVLAAVQQQQRSVILFDPPALPFASALAACGLDLQQLYVVRSHAAQRGRAGGPLPAADILWALEQSLASGQVGALLAWLPARLAADSLRRLQLAAQAHDGPAFLLREEAARLRPSPAPLRLLLRPAGPDELRLQLLKRRGPPLARPLTLALAPVLAPALRARALRSSALPARSEAPGALA